MANWVINPSLDMPTVLEQYGRFLEDDYRMLIESLRVPSSFDEYSEEKPKIKQRKSLKKGIFRRRQNEEPIEKPERPKRPRSQKQIE